MSKNTETFLSINALVWESCDSLSREFLIFNANKLLPGAHLMGSCFYL